MNRTEMGATKPRPREKGEIAPYDRLATVLLFSPPSSVMATTAPEDGTQEATFQNISLGGKSPTVRSAKRSVLARLVFFGKGASFHAPLQRPQAP